MDMLEETVNLGLILNACVILNFNDPIRVVEQLDLVVGPLSSSNIDFISKNAISRREIGGRFFWW